MFRGLDRFGHVETKVLGSRTFAMSGVAQNKDKFLGTAWQKRRLAWCKTQVSR